MSSTVQEIINAQGELITIQPSDTVQKALELMTEHDYSQLPVVDNIKRLIGNKERKGYIITSDSILQALKYFHVQLHTGNLLVSHAMILTSTFRRDDDPFDIFKELIDNQAVLVEEGEERQVVGIVTSFDATTFFRRQAEDFMLVEDIESTVKDYITLYFKGAISETDRERLHAAVETITGPKPKGKGPSFDDLTLFQYISLFTHESRWDSYKKVFMLERETAYQLLDDVRKIRNKLMHFSGDITITERKALVFCKKWLEKHRIELEELFPLDDVEAHIPHSITTMEVPLSAEHSTTVTEFINRRPVSGTKSPESTSIEMHNQDESLQSNSSRYAPFALYLRNKSIEVQGEKLTFKAIEEIIQYKLPASARRARSWWANDSVGHVQSQEWLDVGWRVSSVNMEEEIVLFTRIHERADKYKDFFNALYSDLAKVASFFLKSNSSEGRNWMVVAQLLGPTYLDFAFTRRKRFRVELYIDTGDKDQNKYIFNALLHDKHEIAENLGDIGGSIEWERIDDKRASRVAIYHDGSIEDSAEELLSLRTWAVDTMIKFQKVIVQYLDEIDGI